MPNHCNNEIQIKFASQEDASTFLNKVNADDSIARAFRPMPAILEGTTSPTPEGEGAEALAETGFSNWYDWANTNWGTKWGDYDLNLDKFNESVTGHFTTAWGPLSEDFWEDVSTAYPDAQILVTYDEPGMGFEGAEAYFDGQCLYSETQEARDLASIAEYALEEVAG